MTTTSNTPITAPSGLLRHGATRCLRIIGVAVALAALQACSAVKLGYNNIDEVAYWWIDSYVDFTPEQSKRVRQDLTALHRWHRENELRPISELLKRAEQLAPGDVSADQVCSIVSDMRTRLQAVAARAEGPLTTLALDIEPDQVQTLQKKYAKLNAEFRKEWIDVSAEKRADHRFKQVLERSEKVYGRLDEPQRSAIRKHIAQSSFDPRISQAERLRQQQDVLSMLASMRSGRPSLEEARKAVRGVVERGFNSPDPKYRAYQQTLQAEGCQSFAAAHATTTAAQRENAVQRMRGYQADVAELVAQQP